MLLQRMSLALAIVPCFLSSSANGALPQLKAGVRLELSGFRSQGGAAAEIVDWNNDGLSDLVVGRYSGALHVYLSRGVGPTGLIFEKTDIPRQDSFGTGGIPTWVWRFNKANCVCPGPGRVSPRVLDWDNDGKKDLVIGDGRGAQTRIWRNIGSDAAPVFSTHHLQHLPPDAGVRPYHETVQPCLADFNGDGNRDLLMGRNRGIYVYLNQGTNDAPDFNFDRSRLGVKIRGVFPSQRLCPVVVDWDSDGKSDLLVGSQQGDVWFVRNVGSKSQPKFDSYTPVQAGGQIVSVASEARIAVGDLDGDGQSDLVVGDGTGVVRFFQASYPHPVARSRLVHVKGGSSASVKLVGTDDAQRNLTYRVLTQPQHGMLPGTAPNLTYTPNKGFVGRDQFTFQGEGGKTKSSPATVMIEVQGADRKPAITGQPDDQLVAIGQSARFRVVASGTPPFSYQWQRDGKAIPQATGSEYVIRKTSADDSAKFSVTVTGAAGRVTSREASLQVKPLPGKEDNVPVIDILYKSPVIEPATPGVLEIIRTGNLSKAVDVKLTSRPGHYPVIADVHYVPVPSSIRLKPGQKKAEIRVTPIDNTLTGGMQTLTFFIVPNPAYRTATKLGAATMKFLDDDCPHVGIRVVKGGSSSGKALPTFQVTAIPAPRRDTKIAYSVGGTAIGGKDYETLPGEVTIPAGQTTARIVVKPYRRAKPEEAKTVVLTLPNQPFTFFDFYRYLTKGQPRTASTALVSSANSPEPPRQSKTPSSNSAAKVEKLRREVSQLGWILFAARSGGPGSDLDLFLMRPDGSQLRNLTNSPKFDEHSARMSPDGKKMLYRRVATGKRTWARPRLPQDVGTVALRTWPSAGVLVMASADGSEPKVMGSDGAQAWATWGPEGKRIACLEEVEVNQPDSDKPATRARKPKPSYQIVIRDAKTMEVLKTMRSGGIHSQAVWSPDGKRICGPANLLPGKARYGKGIEYPLGIGKMASVEIETGRRTAMARFPDWSPVWATDSDGDWFQGGSPSILHSANNYGICPAYYAMLWRSGLEGKPSELVYAQHLKHVWGGCTSPDDKYAIFVIGGDSWPLAGKMAIIRLADAPIARGQSLLFHELLADLFPTLKQGPVLDLDQVPEGFQPHWTPAVINTP